MSLSVTVNSQHLAAALRRLNTVVPSKPPIPILGYALIEAQESTLRLSATDLEVTLALSCAAVIGEAGKIAMSVEKLLKLIEQFPDAPVIILADTAGVHISCGRFTSKLQTLAATDFPTLWQPESVGAALSVVISGAVLSKLIGETRYAVADRGKTLVLETALLKTTGSSVGMVTTDTKRLAITTATLVGAPELIALIPRKTLDILTSFGPEPITIWVGINHLFFGAGDVLLTSRIIEGTYPAYERIIPRTHDKTMTIDRLALAAALRRVGVAAELSGMTYLTFEADQLSLRARSADIGEADEYVAAGYEGESVTIAVNYAYVLDFLDAATGETITIAFKDAKTPLLLSDGASFINVIMVMKG